MNNRNNKLDKIITPPSCIGIIGGGQLARMLAISAKQMGYKIAILEAEVNCPASYFADYHVRTSYTDTSGLNKLAELSDVITVEFENIPDSSIEFLAKNALVYPSAETIQICQNRLKEKDFFNKLGYKTAKYTAIRCKADIDHVNDDMYPAILKTNTLGYDGKGQISVNNKSELIQAFATLESIECILEKKISINKEISAIIVKSPSGKIALCSISENIHHNGILYSSKTPAFLTTQENKLIRDTSICIMNNLNCVGLLTIEYFIDNEGNIIINEMAPRPHNSGHLTINACTTSQFEQCIRAICNLSLGETENTIPALMLNLLGDLWINHNIEEKFSEILGRFPNVKLHLYEKIEPKIGRKM